MRNSRLRRWGLGALLVGLAALTSGCATVNGPTDPRDPLERFNRSVYAFNDAVDEAVMRPVAEGYTKVVPRPVRSGVSNFFSNLGDVSVIANDLLQLKFAQAVHDSARFIFNTTFGLFGLIDIATPMGLHKNNEDFGQTLGYWGVPPGPYIVLPFLGPSTARDGAGMWVDYYYADPVSEIDGRTERWSVIGLDAVDTRASLLGASRVLEQAALDPYVFLRDAYLQRRRNLVYDGAPPPEEFDDFWDDDPTAPAPPPAN